MADGWSADLEATIVKRVGKSPAELGNTSGTSGCPDVLELSNGDFAIIGQDLTDHYGPVLPAGAVLSAGERLVIVPRNMLAAAKRELPDG